MCYRVRIKTLLAAVALFAAGSPLHAQTHYPVVAPIAGWPQADYRGPPGLVPAASFQVPRAEGGVVQADFEYASPLDGAVLANFESAYPLNSIVPANFESATALDSAAGTNLDAASAPAKAPEKKADSKKDKPAGTKSLTPLSTKCGDITFTPGVRIQPRYTYDDATNNHDIFIRRFRLKGSGDAFDVAKYGVELKIDNTGRFEAEPRAEVENAWLDFKTGHDDAFVRVGLYDIPFSYNALTSDSKLLLMDRTLIKEFLTTLGMTDNTIGAMLHGRPYDGRLEYAVGVFDNVAFERFGAAGIRESDQLMPAGRIALNLLDPATPPDGYADYRESYIGEGQRLSIGANSAYLPKAFDGPNEFNLHAWGTDVFFNSGPWTVQAEYDFFAEDMITANPDIDGDGWYVQGGCLLGCLCGCEIEAASRYQVLDRDHNVAGDTLRWTSVGFNIYIRDHNLKIQTDYTFKREEATQIENDLAQVQLQLDY